MEVNSSQLPSILANGKKRQPSNSFSVPFSQVKYEMGELNYNSNTESSEVWKKYRYEEVLAPIGLKTYDLVGMREIPLRKKYESI